ncbi:transporter, partial [Natronoarchaeum mannanilyticum]
MATTERIDRRTIGLGAALGAAAYVLGYLVTYVTQRGSVEERFEGFNFVADLLGGDPIPAWKGVGWLFYNAHFVDTEIPGFGGTQTRNFVANADGGSLALLFLVPPLLLLGAGVVAATLSRAATAADG